MKIPIAPIHVARAIAAAALLTAVAGCNSGPHQNPPSSSARTDGKDRGSRKVKTSGPHQSPDRYKDGVMGTSGPHQ